MPQFKYLSSFGRFRNEVAQRRRYVRTPEAEEFLHAVTLTCKDRLQPLAQGTRLWRAQCGNDWEKPTDESPFSMAVPYSKDRMKPRKRFATEGRINPKGIPCLYLATTAHAAMSEVKPWLSSTVSVAQFEILRPLKFVDCTLSIGRCHTSPFVEPFSMEVDPTRIDESVWTQIDEAFTEPVMPTDTTAEYAATQILAELFRSEGYDGVAYKSAYDAEGKNIALFDLECAAVVNRTLCTTEAIDFKFEQYKNVTQIGMLGGKL
jgi:RES domain